MPSEYIYGINPAFEVLRAERRKIFKASIIPGRNNRLEKLKQLLSGKNIPLEEMDKGKLMQRTRSREHQGIALECETYLFAPLEAQWGKSLLILLDNIEDPHNLGAVLRSAEFFGVNGILLPQRGTPAIYPSVVKASAGATEHLEISRAASAVKYVQRAKELQYKIIALDGKGKISLPDYSFEPKDKILLVIGGEDKSVGQYILNHADTVLRIPGQGKMRSLNASVAAAVGMFSLVQKGL